MIARPMLAVVMLPFASSSGCNNLCGHTVSQTNMDIGLVIGVVGVVIALIVGLGYGVGYCAIWPAVKNRRAEKSR